MKIKELHLRNIASIEEADIDFEKDLKDGITGKDASVFLISGDTGAGKSVILDGISMALYKKTPRCEGVANKKENDFTDASGECISVTSIEQYTRLGISEKDECYSEVAFTGNDGKQYRARLTLGLLLGNTDKATGKRPLKHRTPVWEIKIGTDGWIKCNEQIILQAVGLTFQQFGRMAMLAQGQFATFLTGAKTEREEILEQLTNTEHFTNYGKAIESLFKKAKEAKETVQTIYDTEAQHCLKPEDLDALTSRKAELEASKAALDKKASDNDDQLAQVTVIETNRITADREAVHKAALVEIVNGKEYKSSKALVSDWDATATERQRLSDRRDALSRLKAAAQDEARQKETFTVLSADMEARREDIKSQGNPAKSVEAKQAEIDALTAKRSALNPAKINEDLSRLSTEKVELGAISTKEDKIREDEALITKLQTEIAADRKTDETNQNVYAKAKSAYDAAKTRCDEAGSRLTTMSASVKDTLITIRKRLAAEHEEVCPLCGQKLSGIDLDGDFRNIVTPFEKEYDAAKETFDAADKACKEAKSTLDKFAGALAAKARDLETKQESIKASKDKLSADASKLGINITESLPEQIAQAQDSLAKRETELKAAQKQAEDIQGQIEKCRTEKKPLDAALQKYTSDVQKLEGIEALYASITEIHPDWKQPVKAQAYPCTDISSEWNRLYRGVSATCAAADGFSTTIRECNSVLEKYFSESGKTEADLEAISGKKAELDGARKLIKDTDEQLKSKADAVAAAEKLIREALDKLGITEEKDVPEKQTLLDTKAALQIESNAIVGDLGSIKTRLEENAAAEKKLAGIRKDLDKATACYNKWESLNKHFGGTRFRTLVQTYILRPLLNNANIYLEQITDRYCLTCSEDNEQLSILVLDRYNKDQIRSATVLSGGERFMISLALSLALSSLNRPDMNVNILFIDEGFGTLDEHSLESVMQTLEKLQEIAGQSDRRVGIISHRKELDERVPVQVHVKKHGEGRSSVKIKNTL